MSDNNIISASDFQKMIESGALVKKKGNKARFSQDLSKTTVPVVTKTKVSVKPSIEVQKALTKTVDPYESSGERHLSWYFDELITAGFIQDVIPHPEPYKLSEEVSLLFIKPMKRKDDKLISRKIIDGHIYTPDFKIIWNPSALGIFYEPLNTTMQFSHIPFLANRDKDTGKPYSIIEAKPEFDQNNMTRLFRINQKWIMNSLGIFIQLIKTPSFFKDTFMPIRYLQTDISGKARQIDFHYITLREYLEQHSKTYRLP